MKIEVDAKIIMQTNSKEQPLDILEQAEFILLVEHRLNSQVPVLINDTEVFLRFHIKDLSK